MTDHFVLTATRDAALPMLAWVAEVDPAGRVALRCGHGVEVGEGFFVEGVWDGPFAASGFYDSSAFFGTGGLLRPDGVGFAASIAIIDWIFEATRPGRVVVSNSLPLLLATLGERLDPRAADFARINDSITDGIDVYADTLPTETGAIRRHIHRNLLVRDGGFRGCAISLRRLDTLRPLPEARLEVGAGVTNGMLCRVAAESCMSGVEFLCGIPGSFGGALAMNAGAHGFEILQLVERLDTLRGGELVSRPAGELEFGYRYLTLLPGEIVVSARLRMAEAERRDIEERMAGYQAHRGGTQRVTFPSAGSFFKNPPGQQAWRLIDQAGLRGFQVGKAQVSEVHANFLVNRGGATSTDFLALAALVKVRVEETSSVELEEEVRIIGEG